MEKLKNPYGKREVWKNPKSTVVKGLAQPLPVLLARQAQGIPVNVSTRGLESIYKNLDLTDIDKMSQTYITLKREVQEKRKQFELQKIEQAKQQQEERQKMLDFIAKQNEQKPPINPMP